MRDGGVIDRQVIYGVLRRRRRAGQVRVGFEGEDLARLAVQSGLHAIVGVELAEGQSESSFRIGIRSAPHRVACIFAEHAIRKRFGDQSSHLAPLYRDADGLRLNLPTSGLIVPTLRAGFMRVWLHYKTPEDRQPRWITSSHLPGGSKVEPSIHIVGAEHAHTSRVALVVNHALEAEGMAAGGILTVIGLNNVTPAALVAQLREEWPALAGLTLALDQTSPFLLRASRRACGKQ